MSQTIDQKVVEMRFDNKQFESNVQTSMSSIDKLKQKLNFTGATKGLENIGDAAKKVNMTGLGSAVETIHTKFSALEVVGVTALANIANSAVNAGKRIISSLTLDPILTGFQEYETQMNAIQTILANTQSKGSTLTDVTAALDELNAYADQTIYNFTEMTKNIGTFTAAGVDLDKSVTSIKGIANLAAVSGSNSQQAATAMYQLSQALAAGKVQLMDWNSVVNAGMGGELFQTALIRTATQMGTNVDALIKKYGSFRESLTKGEWLTAEVLTETLTQLSGAYTEADLIAQGYTESQAKEIVELAQTAVDAATKVKTFTQLMDTAKEAAQSGWAQTWKLIFGDFEEAKDFFTRVSNMVNDFIVESGEARNKVLGDALNSPWDNFILKVNEAGVSTEDFTEQLKIAAKTHGVSVDELIKEHGSLNNVIAKGLIPTEAYTDALGKFSGETAESAAALKEANEYIVKTGDNLTKIGAKYGMTWQELYKLNQDIIKDPNLIYPEQILKLGDAQLKQVGYTEKQISALRDLAKQAQETGTPINELVEKMGKPSGRQMLFATMSNAVEGFLKVLTTVKSAWGNVFPPENLSAAIYNFIELMYNVSDGLIMSDDTAGKLRRTFEGLFAILDIVSTLVAGPFKLAFKVLSSVLGAMDIPILDFTANLGDGAVALRDFLFENELVTKAIDVMADGLIYGIEAIRKWIEAFLDLPFVQSAISNLSSKLSELSEIGSNAIEGFQNGLKDGLYSIPEILIQIGKNLLEAIKNVLGIHSPSTEMMEVGTNTIQGLINGLSQGSDAVLEWFKSLGGKITESIKSINWGSLAAIVVSAGLLVTVKRLVDVMEAFSAPLQGVGDVLSGVGEVLEKSAKQIAKVIKSVSKVINGFANVLNAKAFSMRLDAIKGVAIGLALLAASLYLLAQLDSAKLWESIGAIAALAAVIGVLSIAVGKFGPDKIASFGGFALAVVSISTSLLIMAGAIKMLASVDPEKSTQIILGFVGMVGSLMAVLAVYGQMVKGKSAQNISKVGTMMLGLSVSLLLMVAAIKLISGLSASELIKGGSAITVFVGIVALLSLITNTSGKGISKLGGMMLQLSTALILMTVAVKLISGMSAEELIKGGAAITAFVGIVGLLSVITNFGGKTAKLGTTLLAMSASMLILAGVIKVIAGMEVGDVLKGLAAITAFTLVIGALTVITNMGGKNANKLSLTLLAMSASIGILAGVAILLSLIDVGGLAKGIIAIGALSTIMAGLIAVTHLAKTAKAEIITITVAIAVLATAVSALSFIDPARLAGATTALSILMGMFALIVKSTGAVTASMAPLIVMTVAVGLLGGIVIALSTLPIENVISTAASLSVLIISLSAAMRLASGMGGVSAGAIVGMAAMALILGLVGGVLALLNVMNVEPSIQTALALSTLLLGMAGAVAILGIVGPLAAGAIQGAAALAAVIAIIAAIVLAAGGIAQIPGAKWLAEEGGAFLKQIGLAIGGFVGSIVGGFAAGVTAGLPAIGTNLSDFMTNVQPFIEGAKSIDPSLFDGVTALAKTILILTAADILNALTSWFTGGSSLSDFAEQLVPFGESMKEFSSAITGMDSDLVTNASFAGKALAEMAATLPNSGGVVGFFTGENDIETFGAQLVTFGEGMYAYSQAIKGMDADAVINSATAGKALAEMAATLPNTGGVVGFFTGENDIDTFAEKIVPFGKAIKEYSLAVSGLDVDAVTNSTTAGQALTELASTIPNTGGLVSYLTGDNDFETFGSQLTAFGSSIMEYSQAVKGLDADAITNSITAGESLVALADTIPNTGGLITLFTGNNDMTVFGDQLVVFGEKFKQYSDYVKDIDPDIVTKTTNAAQSLVALSDGLPEDKLFTNETWLDEFGEQLSEFGRYFSEYYGYISSINASKLSSVIDEANDLVAMAKGMSDLDTSGMASFGKNLAKLGNEGIDDFIDAFSDASSRVSKAASDMLDTFSKEAESQKSKLQKTFASIIDDVITAIKKKDTDFKTTAIKYASSFIDGANSRATQITGSFSKIVSNCVTTIRSNYGNFRSAGSYLVDGFANGIQVNTWKATAQSKAMASAAEKAAKDELGIHSPSVVFEGMGTNVVEGFANGITNNTYQVDKASSSLGQAMIQGFEEQIGTGEPVGLGSSFVEQIAVGITEDMSAEESAVQKAKNIVEVFQKELSKLDLDSTTADLEYEIWEKTTGASASNTELSSAQLSHMADDIRRQQERVYLANMEYKTTVSEIGSSSEEAQEAYNKLLQEQSSLIDLVNEHNSAQEALVESNRQAYLQYVDYLRENRDLLINFGHSMEEIEAAALRNSGYDPTIMAQNMTIDVEKAVEEAMTGVYSSYKTNVESTFGVLVANSSAIGNEMAVAIGTGIQNGAPEMGNIAANMVSTCVEKVKNQKPQWKEIGTTMADSIGLGVSSKMEDLSNTTVTVVNASREKVSNENDNWKDAGSSLVDAFAEGITANAFTAEAKAKAMAEAALAAARKVFASGSGGSSDYRSYAASGTSTAVSETANAIKAAFGGSGGGKVPNIEIEATVRPVIDGNPYQIKSEIGKLSSDASLKTAISIAVSREDSERSSSSGAGATGSGTTTYQFTQNNYSPKSLSRVEIYRQTSNLISASERKSKT